MLRRPKEFDTRQRIWRLLRAVPLALVLVMLGFRRSREDATSVEELTRQARQALAEAEYDRAEMLCRRALERSPECSDAWRLAGEVAAKQGRLDDAVADYCRVSSENPAEAADARLAAANLLLATNRAAAAERVLRECLNYDPRRADAHERLAWLLTIEGRRFESLAHVYELLRLHRFTVSWLMAAGNHDEAVSEEARLREFRAAEPDNVRVLIGLARMELFNKKNRAEARRLLESVVADRPEELEAHALLGRILWDERDLGALVAWQQRLPAAADAHPDVWLLRGQLAKEANDLRAAARCFWEALRRDANHQAANYQLSQVMHSLGANEDDVNFLARRARELEELVDTLFDLRLRPNEPRLLRRAASLCESLGRPWEAWGWSVVASSLPPGSGPISPPHPFSLSSSADETLADCDPGRRLDLSAYPLPASSRRPASPRETTGDDWGVAGKSTAAAFREQAALASVNFLYFRGCEPGQPDGRMFQFSGGGVAALDFDLDGWPDLYFAQGCRWPPQAGQTEFLDQLFRNQGGEFAPVTSHANLVEERFSQGVTVGDFDADGFPDLYVANIGVNRLFVNCGDGTFLDVTARAGLSDASWTTSCLLADLSGDGLPDIYDVNYVAGEDVFEQACEQGGVSHTCSPRTFSPEADRFWLNLGDGRFEDRTESSGLSVPGGNGLALVAANFDGSGRLGLFVANDQDPDFYFLNQGPRGNSLPQFRELGVLSGLAFDGQGKAQASMGVAAGDANGDGKLDLFVTDYYRLSSALYVQRDADLFEEAAAAAGLQAPSYEMLGFGAQFLDGELDGLPDLAVANGHLDDLRDGTPYQMRPQYFRNLGGGRFAEVESERLGAFFSQLHVGRALARLDFNRDGREDFVVTHLDEPAALVSNETKHAGHFLALRLHGTRSARDAIGTRVTVSAGGKIWTRELTAGDGYMASNERRLVFGLRECASVDEIKVQWPSGAEQVFGRVHADAELVLIEGRDELVHLPR